MERACIFHADVQAMLTSTDVTTFHSDVQWRAPVMGTALHCTMFTISMSISHVALLAQSSYMQSHPICEDICSRVDFPGSGAQIEDHMVNSGRPTTLSNAI